VQKPRATFGRKLEEMVECALMAECASMAEHGWCQQLRERSTLRTLFGFILVRELLNFTLCMICKWKWHDKHGYIIVLQILDIAQP